MIDPVVVLDQWSRPTPELRNLVNLFLSPEFNGGRFLFGRNEHSAILSETIDIDGFIDDFAEPGTVWKDKPVFKRGDIQKQAIIVNCVLNAKPIIARNMIEEIGVKAVLAYSDLYKAHPDLIALPNFVSETRSDIQKNRKKWEIVSASLFDDQSRRVLDDIIQFRLTGDYRFMSPYSFRPHEQYFEDFLNLDAKEIFVDAGGYDGETSEIFCKRYPDYEKVFLFEPSPISLEKAKIRLEKYHSIDFIQLGVSNSICTLRFDPGQGSASNISEYGSSQIDVTTLDQHVAGKVTFIKMDLEGWELKALEGARRHIIEDHPKLAIAAYHDPSHFWKIFEFVVGLREDYNIFLRHYTESWTETVMYFVPR